VLQNVVKFHYLSYSTLTKGAHMGWTPAERGG